ncbi:MAG: ATP-dependent DNA helicase [Candidatus Paceibacterota bacterium]
MFKKSYQRLNPEQKEAVDTIEGPVMVIAGPGTGKTQILTLRIANILEKTDTEPENILAITFTESGVASMKKRLAQLIGSPAYYVNITTFHAFANSIIFDYPDQFEQIIGSRAITEVEQVQILEKLIEKLPGKSPLKPFGDPHYYLKSILASINSLKREAVSVEEFRKIVKEEEKSFASIEDLYHEKGAHKGKMKGVYQKELKNIEKNNELSNLFESYQEELKKQKLYDYSDMLIQVLDVLKKDKDLLFQLQESFHYVLVDEHQDTNNAQNKILELLMNFHKSPNIFVVGDEKQAIYRFQGASLENFLYFQKLYPEAELIKLESNYRSSQTILNAAHAVKKSSIDPKIKLKAQSLHQEKQLYYTALETAESENYFLAKSIQKKLKEGANPSEVAVLYRDNRDALPIAHMLEKFGIPFLIESDQNIFEDEDIKKLLLLLESVNSLGSEESLIRLMHADFLGIAPFDIYRSIAHCKEHKKKVLHLLKDAGALQNLGLESAESMHKLFQKLENWKRKAHFQNFAQLFEEIVRESGFLPYILSLPNAAEKLDKLNALFDEVKSLVANHKEYLLSQFIDYIELLKSHDLLIKKAPKQSAGKVRLMTAHKSKGMEFDTVYIANAFDGHWGNRKKKENIKLPAKAFSLLGQTTDDAHEDERNLFYVALTRARKEVLISYAQKSASERDQLPSQYLSEIDAELLKEVDTTKLEEAFKKEKDILFSPSKIVARGIGQGEKEFLNELFLSRGLSVTALNNYLKCPWQFFFKNLVRLPQAKTKHMSYGTAIHEALHKTLEKVKEGEPAKKAFLLTVFETELEKEPLSKAEFEELLEKGKEALSIYFDANSKSWSQHILYEFNVKHVSMQTDSGQEFSLNGKIDKIEINPDTNECNVVDYKTGKPKSAHVLQGKTKSSTGDYHRQLVLYKLLLDNYLTEAQTSPSGTDGGKPTPRFKMRTGEIDFVEPDNKGRHVRHQFSISEAQAGELQNQVKKVAEEILNLSFWDKTCNEADCSYCELSRSIR